MNKKLLWKVPFFMLLLLMAACTSESGSGEKTIYVGPELVDCVGVAPQKCMQVKENPEDSYTLFYDQIEGFSYEEGFEYEIVVREEQVENPPADGSSIKWTLVEVVNKTPAAVASGEPEDESAAEVTDETDSAVSDEENVVTVQVGPEMVDCEGEGPQKCMLVKQPDDAEYGLFYSNIDGFEFEPGYEYVLRVRIDPVENPPAGGSSLNYTLVEEVSKTPVESEPKDETETDTTSDELALEGPLWGLQGYRGEDGSLFEPLPGSKVTAQFEEGRVAGNAGCNSYSGAAEVDGDNLTIGPLASTMAFCAPEELMQQETAFLTNLQSATTYEIVDNQLILRDGEGADLLIFEEVEATTLEGTLWMMTNYNNGREAVVSVAIDTEVTALFEDGQLSGNGGCNQYSGGYELEGESISIGPLISTQMFCAEPEGTMDQETLYLAALEAATTYEIKDDRLDFYDDKGSRQLTFVAAKEEELPLVGTDWNLTSFHTADAVTSILNGSTIGALFAEDGQVSGSAGCNNYFGGYTLAGDSLTVGPLGASRMACSEPDGVMQQETVYLSMLDSTASYVIDGATLTLLNADGAALLSYVAAK